MTEEQYYELLSLTKKELVEIIAMRDLKIEMLLEELQGKYD